MVVGVAAEDGLVPVGGETVVLGDGLPLGSPPTPVRDHTRVDRPSPEGRPLPTG